MRPWVTLALAVVVSVRAEAALAASLSIEGYAQADNAGSPQVPFSATQATGPISGGVFNSGSDSGPSTGSSVSASADYGRLSVFGRASADPFPGVFSVSAGSVTARWSDVFTIIPPNPAQMFQRATLRYRLALNGSLTADAGGSSLSLTHAEYSWFVTTGTCSIGCTDRGFGRISDGGWSGDGHVVNGDYPPHAVDLTTEIFLGVERPIDVLLGITVQASSGDGLNSAVGVANFSNTLEWGGILDLRDAQGAPITGWSVSSQSGLNYAVPVPEPATALLLGLGVAGLVLARAWKQQERARGLGTDSG